jgi:hypothetical protein
MSHPGAAALAYWLSEVELRPKQCIAFIENSDKVKICRGVPEAVGFITHLMAALPAGRHPRFSRRQIELSSGACREQFRDLAYACLEMRCLVADLRPMLSNAFLDKFLIIEVDCDSGRLFANGIGDGYPALHDQWRRNSAGGSIGVFSDSSYQAFALSAYRQAATQNSCSMEQIDATVHYPGSPPIWMNYDRMIVPLSTNGSRKRLLSVTIFNQRVVVGG